MRHLAMHNLWLWGFIGFVASSYWLVLVDRQTDAEGRVKNMSMAAKVFLPVLCFLVFVVDGVIRLIQVL